MYKYEQKELKTYIEKLRHTFDVVRIVDPIKNIVPFTDGMDNMPVKMTCYDFWKRGKICENCTSFQAIKNDRAITKIEYCEENVFLVISTPVEFNDSKYAIEMLFDINEINTIKYINKENNDKIQGLITNLEENLLIDELTGVYNRRFINRNLPFAIENGDSIGIKQLAVIMVDIDDFKYINDTYGHLAGDGALKKVADIIKTRVRSGSDWLARYGGDEFVVLLKNADESVVNRVIEEIQSEIKDCNFMYLDTETEITLSFGVKVVEAGTVNYETVLKAVDKNLNQAKCSGKNKVVIS